MSREHVVYMGHGYGLDADLLDGMHAQQIVYEARKWGGGGPEAGLPCSFLIFKEGNNYKAINGATGKIAFGPSTDAAAVIQAAINALTSGGKIFIKAGTYLLSATSTLPSKVWIQGEGKQNTILQMSVNNTNIFTASGNPSEYVKISDLTLYGRKNENPTDTGVGIYGKFRYSTVEHLRVYRCGRLIVIEDSADAVDCWDNHIIASDLWSSVSDAVVFGTRASDNIIIGGHIAYATGTDAAGLHINGVGGHRVYGTVFDCSYYNILIEGGAGRFSDVNVDQSARHGIYIKSTPTANANIISFIGGKVSRASEEIDNTYSGIYIEGHADKEARNIQVIGVNFLKGGAGAGQQKHSIEFAGVNERDITLIGNDFRWGYQTSAIGGTLPTSSQWSKNDGFVTENIGTATFSGTGAQTVFTIAHGCAAIPTHVSLEAKSADATGVKYWSADATNITVTFITAPPSGTNNVVIGWKAEV